MNNELYSVKYSCYITIQSRIKINKSYTEICEVEYSC